MSRTFCNLLHLLCPALRVQLHLLQPLPLLDSSVQCVGLAHVERAVENSCTGREGEEGREEGRAACARVGHLQLRLTDWPSCLV